MKIINSVVGWIGVILMAGPLVYGQDLSTYRTISFGTTVADVCRLVGKKPADAVAIRQRTVLIQQLTWWPALNPDSSLGGGGVREMRFSFLNDQLYRIAVTYDSAATRGFTPEDMVKVVAATYGAAKGFEGEVKDEYGTMEKVLARWEDSRYSFNLFRSSLSNNFRLLMIMKQLDAQAEDAGAEAASLEALETSAKELARAKSEADDLETERQKNMKAVRP
jgi:hypothetical protein